MVEHPVIREDLLKAREDLIQEIVGRMPEPHKRFLISVKKGQPEWTLLDLSGANDLPAVRWKLDNLAKHQERGTATASKLSPEHVRTDQSSSSAFSTATRRTGG